MNLKAKTLAVGTGMAIALFMGANSASAAEVTHTVQPGDTLSNISQKYFGDRNHVDYLAQSNKVLDANLIYVGESLTFDDQGAAIQVQSPVQTQTQEVENTVETQVTPEVTQTQEAQPVLTGGQSFGPGDARAAFDQITADYGISGWEKEGWASIIERESGWQTQVWNSAGSGAYGLPQSLPASKMASAGADWETNPYTQLKWMYNYMNSSYGSIGGAVQFWNANHWY